ncbi:TIGR00341 family protein [Natrinema halophilum]|uniref:TIGR00341 family protein n=1 Tax=Natrinema halophilum TaxID=1699371 RepID=A0A7D5KQ85_9EURY|nr:TIGR00341 family protein [Natrinema halophilum]QLG48137.1 TIGR00341 family protein [Natrinema halophilum]
MRYLEITVPNGRRRAVIDILEAEGIDYVVSDETSDRGYTAVIRFPLPTRAVEPVLDRLAEAGIDEARVVVIDAEAVISRDFDDLLDRYSHGGTGERTSRQVLRTKADELTPAFSTYVAMLIISAIVATAGLLSNSPAVVVGSMVIAPLVGPALAANVGIVTADDDLRTTGFRYQLVGIVIVIGASTVLALLARLAGLEPAGIDIVVVTELEERVSPNLLSLAVALGAGVAGIISLTRGFSEAIVGVMIAAALIPPAAATGITAAWGMNGAAIGAFVLVVVNVLSINAAALVTLWVAGYRPQGLFEVSPSRKPTVAYAAVFGIALLVLTAPLAAITLMEIQTTQLKSTAEEEVAEVVDGSQYTAEEDSVEVILNDDYPIQSIDRVVVTVSGREPGPAPPLGDRIYENISAHVSGQLVVEVQYVVSERYENGSGERMVVNSTGDRSHRSLSGRQAAAVGGLFVDERVRFARQTSPRIHRPISGG